MNALDQRDWAGLLPELVHIIATKIADIFDFIHFCAVCKTWRSVTGVVDLSPQFPWLVYLSHGPNLQFYSISFDKSFTIPTPKFTNETRFYPCRGSMLICSGRNCCSLINPLNNSEVSLPILRDDVYECFGSRIFQSGDYIIFRGFGKLLHVFKPGDKKWISVEGGGYDSTYLTRKNLIFIVDYFATKVINLSTRETVFDMPPPWNPSEISNKVSNRPFLIESSGDVLLVIYEDKKFKIYRLEVGNGEGNPRWVKVTNIGDRILFLDFDNYRGDFSLSATDFRGLNFKGNCIYAIRPWEKFTNFDWSYVVERYDIESATIEDRRIYDECITWYLPDLNHI